MRQAEELGESASKTSEEVREVVMEKKIGCARVAEEKYRTGGLDTI